MELKERKSLSKADRGKYRYIEVFYRGCIDILFLSDIVVIVHFSYRFFWLDSFRASSYIIERKAVAARQGRQGRRRLPAVRIKLNFFMGITYTYLKNISIYIYSSLFTLLSIGKICVGIKKSTPTIIIIPQSRTRTQATFNLRLKNESTIAHYLARSTLSI
jgi:hypothetical protein